jgi:amidase
LIDDTLGAFCRHHRVVRRGGGNGLLAGLTFAVKDVFAIRGETACFGNPTWLVTHPAAESTAPVVRRLLEQGATLVGTTITDELACSLTGVNDHYGTPVNSADPDRVPGGSSSGSAAAVAGFQCDFALGTDTGGSVRVPASHCGLYGFRPTHDAVTTAGVLPFAPRFDTVGWFARDAETLSAVGHVLLPEHPLRLPARAYLVEDAVAVLDPSARSQFRADVGRAALRMGLTLATVSLRSDDAGPLESWLSIYLTLQNAEVASTHREWIEGAKPRFGSLIAGRIARALATAPAEVAAAEERLVLVRRRVDGLVGDGATLILPSACGAALPFEATDEQFDADTVRSLTLGAVASLCGLPQLTLPLSTAQGHPLGLSVLAAAGRDHDLLALARQSAASPGLHAAGEGC